MIRVTKNFDLGRDFDAAMDGAESHLRRVGVRAREAAIAALRESGRVATGDLLNSLEDEVTRAPERVRLEVGPDVSYAEFVHFDTRPHWPPIDPLKKWARAKFGLTGREKDSLAYAVQRGIARRGTKGVPFMDIAFQKVEGDVRRLEGVIRAAL